MATVANVAFTNTLEEQRIKINQAIDIVNQVETGVHPYSNLARQAANTANSVAANIAYTLVYTDPTLMTRVTDSANSIITNQYSQIYQDSNASFARSNFAAITANTAMVIANSAFATANNFVANSSNIIANIILANSSTQNTLNLAVSAYANAFFANISVSASFAKGNAAHLQANTARDSANLVHDKANAAFDQANGVYTIANNAISYSNSIFDAVNASFTQANTATQANVQGTAAFGQANNAYAQANTVFGQANTAFGRGNTAWTAANSANSFANTAWQLANLANARISTVGGGANVAILQDNSTDATFYLPITRSISGNISNLSVATEKLTFNPQSGTLGATIFNSLSDETFKTNLRLLDDPLGKINSLHGYIFNWKDTGRPSSGIIAQELAKVMPYLVESDSDPMTVNYNGLSALFIEAIKALNREIKDLKAQLEKR
jgi:hypothetical protein